MKLRSNLERLVERWGGAKKEDRRAALEGEARAWKLLAHWSGRAEDRAHADDAAAAAVASSSKPRSRTDGSIAKSHAEEEPRSKSRAEEEPRSKARSRAEDRSRSDDSDAKPSSAPEAKRGHERREPAPPEKPSTSRSMLAKVAIEGTRLQLSIDGEYSAKREVIPARAGKGARVFFDLTPVIAAREALGNVSASIDGIARVRVGQFDDDTARVVIDLTPGTTDSAIAIAGDQIALSSAEPEPEPD